MDPRVPRLRRRPAAIPYQPLRSHSFGEEQHRFRLGPRRTDERSAAFETGRGIELPRAYREFLLHLGGSGAAPFYGLMPMERCTPLVTAARGAPGEPCGFEPASPRTPERDLFLHMVEMGCTDVCVLAVTGPLTGRVLTGSGDGRWGPIVSSATDCPVRSRC